MLTLKLNKLEEKVSNLQNQVQVLKKELLNRQKHAEEGGKKLKST